MNDSWVGLKDKTSVKRLDISQCDQTFTLPRKVHVWTGMTSVNSISTGLLSSVWEVGRMVMTLSITVNKSFFYSLIITCYDL